MKAKFNKLFTLLTILTLGISNVWGALTAHVPGVYEKTVATGGYGCTLTTVASGTNAGTFEVYYFSALSKYSSTTNVYGGGGKQQYRLMCADSDSEYQLINRSGTSTFTASCDWIEMAYATTGFSKSDYTFGSNKFNEFFEITPNGGNADITKTCYIKPKEGDVMTLKVSGYVEFAILGNDYGSSKYMTITVDGGTPTSWKSNTLSRRAVSLTTGEHTIVVACVGNSANAFYGFSLKLPSCEKPDAPTGLSCTAQTVNTLTFGWTKETNAVGYVAKLYSDSGCETEVDSKDLGDVNTVTFTGLSNSSTYYCKVQSKGNGTDYCEEGSVTSAANGTTETPSCGVVTAPTSLLVGATTADGAPFTIIDDADAFNYEFYVSDSSTEPESSATATHTSTEKTKDVTGLTSGTTYYAWVRSVCDADHKSTWTAASSSFKVRTNPTASFADANYIIGMSAINVADNFTSNSGATVVYELKESYPNVTLTGSSFSATAAGEYVVVANQAGNADYTPISKEATITVLDNEMSDTYVWKKGTGYTGCVASPNADAPAAQYTDIAYEGFTGMGRAAADNTECILTFSVKAAYSANFGIKSICTYGKLEEPLGGQISWDGGTNWEDLAAYSEGKKEFNAPSATFPTSFKIKFLGVSASSGGLYWRNALVTLEVKKTVTGVTEALVGAEINGAAISSAELTTLLADKTLAIATAYAAAPTVTFKKEATTTYAGGWAPDVENVDVEVTASDNTTAWQASATIGGQAYTINLAKPAGPSLETEATAFTLTSAKITTDTKSFTFSGMNLTSGNVTIALESSVAGMTVTPAEVTPVAGVITDQEVTITYKSLEDVAEANVNLVVYYDADTKIIIPLTYSSTAGVEDLTPISAATTWNWDGAADAAFGTLDQNAMIVLANADVTWDAGFDALAIAGKLQHYYRDSKYAQGNELKFNTTIPGKVYVTYSNTGGNPARTVNVNGTKGSLTTAGTGEKRTESFAVTAGDVLIKGVLVSDDSNQMLRYYEVRFVPVFAVTYDAGEGSVKGGETMPTQADEAAGEKIILAAATALEKDGYDFTGWLCSVDAVTYNAGVEYTMTAAATTFTAQWALHVDPVDPTLTYDNGAYTIGSTALDLSTLITASESTGAITYSVKDAGTTSATVDGNNFTATAAGTAIITASQAAVLGYNAKEVDFNVVVTEATEIDGIKLVEAGALTGNFRIKADQLKSGSYTVEGINYTKYVQMGSTHTSFSGETEGNQSKGIYYAPAKKNIKFWFYMRNTDSSSRKIYIYKMEEGSAVASATVDVPVGSQLVSYDMTLATNAEVVFGVENTKLYFCQIVAVESGDNLLQAGENGYVFDYSKKRQNVAANTLRTIDGMQYYLSADSKINSASNVQLQTLGTHYIKFHLATPMTVKVTIDGTGKQYYIGSECSTNDEAKIYSATATEEFSLAAGDWYINGGGVQLKITKMEFSAPKCEAPVFNGALADIELCAGDPFSTAFDGTATVGDGGTVTYKWYAEGADETDPAAVLGTNATYTPNAEGNYYVIATNSLSGFADNSTKSALVNITQFAAAVITVAPENQRDNVGETVTLSVTATGKNLSYEWFTCDDELGTTPVAIVPAETNASLSVTVAAGTQWYKVVVSSDCGNVEATAKVEEFIPATPQNVTESTTWDWKSTTAGFPTENSSIDFANTSVEELLANVSSLMPNNDAFHSDMLYGIGQRAWRKSSNDGECGFQGFQLRFHTEVAGRVRVYFRAPSSGQTSVVRINGNEAGSRGNSWGWSQYVFVDANTDVVIAMTNGETGMTRVQKLEFQTPDYTRTAMLGNGVLGTLCVDHNVPVEGIQGATFYELSGKNAEGKIAFDQITTGQLDAGVPYVFQAHGDNLALYYGSETEAAPVNGNGFYGTFSDITLTELDDVYYFAQKALWSCTDLTSLSIPANRAYVKLSELPDASPAPAPGRIRMTLNVNGAPQVTTGMENLENNEAPVKMLINGQLFILRGEKLYDATGRLVK